MVGRGKENEFNTARVTYVVTREFTLPGWSRRSLCTLFTSYSIAPWFSFLSLRTFRSHYSRVSFIAFGPGWSFESPLSRRPRCTLYKLFCGYIVVQMVKRKQTNKLQVHRRSMEVMVNVTRASSKLVLYPYEQRIDIKLRYMLERARIRYYRGSWEIIPFVRENVLYFTDSCIRIKSH